MTLEEAAKNTQDLQYAFCTGLQALKGTDRQKIITDNSRALTGSIDIDTNTRERFPQASRWDYVIEYNGKVFFVEIHPADTGKINDVISKYQWLKAWLTQEAPALASCPKGTPTYIWIATKGIHILPFSTQYRKLATLGLIPRTALKLS